MAAVVPQDNLSRVGTPHHEVGMEPGESHGHDGRLRREGSKQVNKEIKTKRGRRNISAGVGTGGADQEGGWWDKAWDCNPAVSPQQPLERSLLPHEKSPPDLPHPPPTPTPLNATFIEFRFFLGAGSRSSAVWVRALTVMSVLLALPKRPGETPGYLGAAQRRAAAPPTLRRAR